MYLEEVRIEGFKSYAPGTGIALKPGIGIIIGNNGVGKSNILDAIAWSLGESDLGRLRCNHYHDLFFNGSPDHPGAQEIKVELWLKTGREKDAPVVRLARQAQRQGEEFYYIGGEPVGERDYHERITEMGLGKAVSTLIRQEEINSFIYMGQANRLKYLSLLLGQETSGLLSKIEEDFRDFFSVLVPGGDCKIRQAEGGLVVEGAFPGKGMKNSLLLSGGEKTICSLALNLAIFEQLNSPFYLFDEVEPSLDWTNHHNMQCLFKRLAEKRQLILITHLRSTIELADTLHGIRSRSDGTSYIKFYFELNDGILRAYKCC